MGAGGAGAGGVGGVGGGGSGRASSRGGTILFSAGKTWFEEKEILPGSGGMGDAAGVKAGVKD